MPTFSRASGPPMARAVSICAMASTLTLALRPMNSRLARADTARGPLRVTLAAYVRPEVDQLPDAGLQLLGDDQPAGTGIPVFRLVQCDVVALVGENISADQGLMHLRRPRE